MEKRTFKLLIAATGSVAALKLPILVKSLLNSSKAGSFNFEIEVITTENAKYFFKLADVPAKIYDDSSELKAWNKIGDPVLHVELGKWADMMVIAPLDANTLAKMSQGICDNLLTCTTRAWDMKKPLLFCPAMNTRMWEHPTTFTQISMLRSWGHVEVPPISKKLACGDVGVGGMAEVPTIVERIHEELNRCFN